MLLPSALTCDVRAPPSQSHLVASRLFSTPPPSEEEVASQVSGGIYNTCRALQSLLGTQNPTPSRSAMAEPLLSPIKLAPRMSRTKISKKVAKPAPRGANKRSRDITDDGNTAVDHKDGDLKFSTPKRMRLAPPELPLGVKRADFEGLESPKQGTSPATKHSAADEKWSAEDDRLLVKVVLEKLKLTEDDWNECAKKLGKESGSIGKRWMELVGKGHVGLRRGGRSSRPTLDGAWK